MQRRDVGPHLHRTAGTHRKVGVRGPDGEGQTLDRERNGEPDLHMRGGVQFSDGRLFRETPDAYAAHAASPSVVSAFATTKAFALVGPAGQKTGSHCVTSAYPP